MKNILYLLSFFAPFVLTAQQTEGLILFAEKVDMHARLGDDPQNEEMKKMIPQFNTTNFELLFSSNASLYRVEEVKESDDEPHGHTVDIHVGGGGTFKMKMDRPQNTYYKDLSAMQSIEQRYFFDKAFIIEKELEPTAWKFTGEAKSILGFECQKAVLQSDDGMVEAWFTSSIPVSTGPASFGQLPGMILEVSLEEGLRTISAVEVNFKNLEEYLVAPDKGKKITEEKYNEMVEERMREMGAQSDGRGGFKVIRIDRGGNN